ncbi:MAG TPA: cell envelope integrity protein CreD [Rhizomicrobium sp.]|jgi:inner membrane protein|nr:cell envelope integrity protein CreD [Rhizomicrobium sp.]
MVANDTHPVPASKLRSPGFKLVILVLLTVLMAVPLFVIQLALLDRQSRANDAAQDIANGWGGAQTVAGPVLFVPYDQEAETVVDGKTMQSTQHLTAVLLPSSLTLDTKTATDTRWRGIFPVPVYRAALGLHAQFDKAALDGFVPQGGHMFWNQASLGVMISDVRGIAGNVTMIVNGKPVAFQPGIGVDGATGIHVPLGLSAEPDSLTLSADLSLRGSRELNFAALGRQTSAHLSSAWPDPSFSGAFLPTEHRIGPQGFDAAWNIPYLARGYGQSFATPDGVFQTLESNSFGVKFYQPVDFYQLVQRSLKYAILFVGLAFLVFFVAEMIVGRRLHAAQYTLMGAAPVLFYLLLLSFAEHIGFAAAYLMAATATVGLTALYAASAFASKARAGALFVVLSGLYGLLYVILIQEDYALLIGALVLFCALGATMFATRRLDWSRIAPEPA